MKNNIASIEINNAIVIKKITLFLNIFSNCNFNSIIGSLNFKNDSNSLNFA